MRRFALAFLGLVTSTFALAVGQVAPSIPTASWPMYQALQTHNAVFSRPGFRVAWVAQLGDRINGGLAIVGDTIYVDSFDKSLYALNLRTGDIRWEAPTDNVLMSSPVVAQGRVIVGTGHNGFLDSDPTAQMWGRAKGDDIIAFDASDGKQLWSAHTVGEDMASPAISGDSVVFANGDLHAYALSLADGHRLWRTPLPGIDSMASAIVNAGQVYISICHNKPHFRETLAIDVEDGRIIWKNSNGSCDSSPAFFGGLLFVDGNDEDGAGPYDPGGRDIIAAIDVKSGRTLWAHVSARGPYTMMASGEHAVAGTVADGVLYQSVVNQDELLAFNIRNGKVLWRVRTVAPVKMSPVVTGDRVIFGDTAGLLYSITRTGGRIIHTAAFRDPFATSPPVVVGQTVIVANGRYVFAIPLNVI